MELCKKKFIGKGKELEGKVICNQEVEHENQKSWNYVHDIPLE